MLDDNVWLSVAGMLVAILVIIGLAYWVTRHIAGGGMFRAFGMAQRGNLKILDQLQLGKDQRLAVIQAAERYFLLGVTMQSISVLAEFTKEEAEQWLQEQEEPQRFPDFKQALSDALRRGKQR